MIQRSNWESLRALFEAALERPPAERAAFLRDQTEDQALRREVESLIAAHEQAEGSLTQSALGPVRASESLVDAPRLAAGSRLGAFEILNRLGTGGMGEVYRARDTRLERFVAIKVLSPTIDIAPRGRERFEREARAISKLSHSHICTVHDVGAAQVDGHELPFLVLELLDGETLAPRAGAWAFVSPAGIGLCHRHGRRGRDSPCPGHRASRPETLERDGDRVRRQAARLRSGAAPGAGGRKRWRARRARRSADECRDGRWDAALHVP